MKRFYTTAAAEPGDAGFAILLDGRPVKTPARVSLTVPGAALAAAIVSEWDAQTDEIDPATMPMTGLANATIDRVLPAVGDFRGQIAVYGESDLLCYRADGPDALVARQADAWEPLLDWARARYAIAFVVTQGIVPVDQPALTLAALRGAIEALDPWLLVGMMKLVSIGGSLVGALALLEGATNTASLWHALTLDEVFQAENWGVDELAQATFAAREAEFLAAARYCGLVQAQSEG